MINTPIRYTDENVESLGSTLRNLTDKLPIQLLVSGSRIITNPEYVKMILDNTLAVYKLKPHILISGGAKGVDRCAELWAKEHNITIKQVLPDWNKYGKRAGMIRNTEMLKMLSDRDALISIWDGKSRGSKHMINQAIEHQQKNLFIHDIYTTNLMIALPVYE